MAVKDRVAWRRQIDGPILHEGGRERQGSYSSSETNFQDFSRTQIDFSRTLKFTFILSLNARYQSQFLLLSATHFIFLLEFNRFPELYRISSLFPGLSSSGKCHNKIPGLSRFSRTRTNPGKMIL